jgi:hypothetical protein
LAPITVRRVVSVARQRWGCLALLLVAVSWLFPQAAYAQTAPPVAQMRSEQSIPLTFNQGIAHIPGGWILSGTNSPLEGTDVLVRTDEQFHVVFIHQPAIPPQWRAQGYDHIGDIDVVGDTIYVPFEEPDYTKGHQVTARYDVTTLLFRDAVVLPQHQNSFVTVDPATMIAYTMDEFDGDSLLRYDVAHGWRSLPALHMSMLLHHTQGASVRGGFIWICTSDDHNDLFRVSLATGHVDNIGRLGHPGGEGEGIDVTPLASGYLHAMIIDPGLTNVWVEHFDLVAASASPAPTATPTPTSPPSIVANNGTGLANTGPPSAVAPLGLVVAGSATVLWWLRRRCSEKPTSRRP